MNTVKETILQYRILKHEVLPQPHQNALRARGIDPETNWTLYMSFDNEVDALIVVGELQDEAADYETFKMVDAGEAQVIERENWF